MRVFMFGDYEFLCNAYGLSGASGKHHCIAYNMYMYVYVLRTIPTI